MPEEDGRQNRQWVPAEYDSGGHKIPGTGIEVDKKSRVEIPNRGANRPDQRYVLDVAEIRSRRAARALAEKDDTLAVRMDDGRVEVVTASENRYDVSGPDQEPFCACPDFARLQVSYPLEDVVCKHILIARMKETEIAPLLLPVGVLFISEALGLSYKTVQDFCRTGLLPAIKQKRTWVIAPDDADAFIPWYRSRMHDPNWLTWLIQQNGVLFTQLDVSRYGGTHA